MTLGSRFGWERADWATNVTQGATQAPYRQAPAGMATDQP